MISIIVPVYNVEQYLDECFQSIDAQAFLDYEVIVVNDGSTDNSLEICHRYADNNAKYHLYSKENGGLMSAWMYGVQKASGDYFGFVDSDDYIHPQMFDKLYSIAKRYQCDIVMCDRYDVINGTPFAGKSCIESGLYDGDRIHDIKKQILPKFNGEHITNARWNKIFRRELYLHNTKYCTDLSRMFEDRFITPSCVFGAISFYYINEPLYFYRHREGSNHSKESEDLQDAAELLYSKQIQMIGDYGVVDKYGSLVDRANLNYLRLLMMRNLSGFSKNIRKRLRLAKKILQSQVYKKQVKQYRDDLVGKAGLLIKMSFATRSSLLFVMMCSFISRDGKAN